jgi:hypothetical protein
MASACSGGVDCVKLHAVPSNEAQRAIRALPGPPALVKREPP